MPDSCGSGQIKRGTSSRYLTRERASELGSQTPRCLLQHHRALRIIISPPSLHFLILLRRNPPRARCWSHLVCFLLDAGDDVPFSRCSLANCKLRYSPLFPQVLRRDDFFAHSGSVLHSCDGAVSTARPRENLRCL